MARVLFLDQEKRDLSGIRHDLGNLFDIQSATSASKALQLLVKEKNFSILVTELYIPDMDGFQFLESVRDASPHTCRIVLTEHPSVEDMHALLSDELAFRYMVKPCPLFKLQAALREGFAEYTKGFYEDGYNTSTTSIRNIRKMKVTHLKYGDEIACHVKDKNGRILISSGAVVDGIILNKLKSMASRGQINDTLTIFGHS